MDQQRITIATPGSLSAIVYQRMGEPSLITSTRSYLPHGQQAPPPPTKIFNNSYHYLNMRGIENSILLSELTTLSSEDYLSGWRLLADGN